MIKLTQVAATSAVNPIFATHEASRPERDGVHAMAPRDQMSPIARKRREFYAITPRQPFILQEFGYYCLDRWRAEEGFPADVGPYDFFGLDKGGIYKPGGLGWCEAPFCPMFEVKILEDRGDHELVQDKAGRGVLYFKGRREGFMPEYATHPLKDQRTWEEIVKWRLDPSTPQRYADLKDRMHDAVQAAGRGEIICQKLIGGYMFLRSLIGPSEIMYMLCENPALIHACMSAWLTLADTVIEKRQRFVTIDELFFAEDICYNNGLLISPDMVREFLFPYYKQLIENLKKRQLDRSRKLHIHIDTDGWCYPAISLYREIGLSAMSPFEVASGCDVVALGREFPDLVMLGGVDKRVLAEGKEAIDRFVDRVFPAMYDRGGYIPTCDHGVPEEVRLDNYLHFRKRCREFA